MIDDELDRELVVREHGYTDRLGKYHDWNVLVKIGKKTLKFTDKGSANKSITFEKGAGGSGRELLEITTVHDEIVYETCSLGHKHEKSKKERIYNWWKLEWHHVESFIEWLQLGSWTEISKKQEPWRQLLSEVNDFLIKVEKMDDQIKPSSQKLRTKIRALI